MFHFLLKNNTKEFPFLYKKKIISFSKQQLNSSSKKSFFILLSNSQQKKNFINKKKNNLLFLNNLQKFNKLKLFFLKNHLSFRIIRSSENEGKQYFMFQGKFNTIIKPILFTLIIVGGVIFLAFNDDFRNWNRKRYRNAYLQRNQSTIKKWWYSWNQSQQTLFMLIGLNGIVFSLWQTNGILLSNNTLFHYFTHSPINPKSSTLLLSCFSHKSFAHFLFNMIALWSFGENVHKVIGREHFLALYIAGGVSSSLISHFFKLGIRDSIPSLGASGAVFSVVAASTYLFPNSQLAFIFFPFVTFSAAKLLPCLVAFDLIGLFGSATKIFSFGLDHAAHLGGVAFGFAYIYFLTQYYKEKRKIKIY